VLLPVLRSADCDARAIVGIAKFETALVGEVFFGWIAPMARASQSAERRTGKRTTVTFTLRAARTFAAPRKRWAAATR
ncbi:MAG: hypothetical protein AAFO77_08735, partial [Pseudomonadota bacterium]